MEQRYAATEDAYELHEAIGSGAYATVYAATLRATGEQLAIKVQSMEHHEWEDMRHEIAAMSLMHHPNVVRILTSFAVRTDMWVVMPRLGLGSCAHILKVSQPLGFKDELVIGAILHGLLSALVYLHADGRIHRDVKAANILVSSTGRVQLGDFGVSCRRRSGVKHTTLIGSPLWLAPEVIEGVVGFDERADIWSVGIVALELAFGRAPHARCQPLKAMMLTLQSEPPTAALYASSANCSHTFSPAFHAFVAACLVKDPQARPSAEQLLKHKFLHKLPGSAEARERFLQEHLAVVALPSIASPTVQHSDVGYENTDLSDAESSWSWSRSCSCITEPHFYNDDEDA